MSDKLKTTWKKSSRLVRAIVPLFAWRELQNALSQSGPRPWFEQPVLWTQYFVVRTAEPASFCVDFWCFTPCAVKCTPLDQQVDVMSGQGWLTGRNCVSNNRMTDWRPVQYGHGRKCLCVLRCSADSSVAPVLWRAAVSYARWSMSCFLTFLVTLTCHHPALRGV